MPFEMESPTSARMTEVQYFDIGNPIGSEINHPVERCEESVFEGLGTLPTIRSNIWKRSPSKFRAKIMCGNFQERLCVLKDCHLFWWDSRALKCSDEAGGYW